MENLIKILKNKALSPNALFFLYAIVNKEIPFTYSQCEYVELLTNLQDQKYIKITDYDKLKYSLREAGNKLIEELKVLKEPKIVTTKKLSDVTTDVISDIIAWIDEYRNLFKSKRPGAMGDKNACVTKMARFFVQYPEHADKAKILSATTKYINGEGLNSNFKYLQQADYFIFKQSNNKDEMSKLASYCDEFEIDDTETTMIRTL